MGPGPLSRRSRQHVFRVHVAIKVHIEVMVEVVGGLLGLHEGQLLGAGLVANV